MKKNGVKGTYLPMSRSFAEQHPALFVASPRSDVVLPRLGSSRPLRQVSCADQVVRRQAEAEHPAHSRPAAMPRLAQECDGLQPPEHLLHALAFPLSHPLAGVARAAPIDSAR